MRPSLKSPLSISLAVSALAALIMGSKALYFVPQVAIISFVTISMLRRGLQSGGTIFHPVPLTAAVMIWSFGLSAAYNAAIDYRIARPPLEIDWTFWLSVTSWAYVVCASLLYAGVLVSSSAARPHRARRIRFEPSKRRAFNVGMLLLVVTGIAQALVYVRFGGVIGYMEAWSESREEFDGLGVLFMVAEAFPILLAMLFVVMSDRERIRRNLVIVIAALLVFFALKLLFGGFRGSRSNTIWGIFWAAGLVHLCLYRLKMWHFAVGMAGLMAFMATYSLYKTYGLDAFSGNYELSSTGRYDDRPMAGVMLSDFSRAGINAYSLHEYFNGNEYEPKLGATYVDSALKLIPMVSNPLSDHSKGSAGAELMYRTRVNPSVTGFHNTRIFGLYGEAILNFGPLLALLLFFPAGYLIGRVDEWTLRLPESDTRILMVPFIANCALMFVLADSDNLVFFVFKNGFLPMLFVVLMSRIYVPRGRLRTHHDNFLSGGSLT